MTVEIDLTSKSIVAGLEIIPVPVQDVVLLYIEVKNCKNPAVFWSSNSDKIPAIHITTPRDEGSVIKTVEFVEHKGYYVFSATVNRYTIGVCLVKEKDEIGEFLALMAGIKKEGEGQ